MENVSSYKIPGVTLTSKLTWSDHVALLGTQGGSLVLCIQVVQPFSLYISLVRPHLEDAAPAWNPNLIRDIKSLESVEVCPQGLFKTVEYPIP